MGTSSVARSDSGLDAAIAVVGYSCRLPQASDPDGFWRLLRTGADAVAPLPSGRWDYSGMGAARPRGGFLDTVDRFDAAFFGMSPAEAVATDPQQRLMLELGWEALEHAGIVLGPGADHRVGMFVGASAHDYAEVLRDRLPEASARHGLAGVANGLLANRVSYALGLRGPSMTVDTAQSSSLVAVHLACHSLREGECTAAVVGGVHLMLTAAGSVAARDLGVLSPDGRCHTFDARANGFACGEGAAAVVLKPLARALAGGDLVHCVIRGSAVNHGGAVDTLTTPDTGAQREVVLAACARAGVDPAAVQYVELHGTGTPAGDPVEAAALGAALGTAPGRAHPLLVGSVKTNLGHLQAAAGITGLLKTVLSLRHRQVPASLHFERQHPRIPLNELNLRVADAAGHWPDPDGPLIAGVSSFGIGGANCHVVLAEPPARVVPDRDPAPTGPLPCVLSAQTPAAHAAQAARLRAHLLEHPDVEPRDVAYSLETTRTRFRHRAVVTASGRDDLLRTLAAVAERPDAVGEEHPAVDWASLGARRVELPTYPFQRTRHWPGPPRSARRRDDDQDVLDVVRANLARILGHDTAEGIDPDTAFRDLGLDSYGATALCRRLRKVAGGEVPTAVLFDHPTPARLAEWLRGAVQPDRERPLPDEAGDPIVIVGMACRLPGGVDTPVGLWHLLQAERDATGEFPADRGWTDPGGATRRGGFLTDAAGFDAGFFGISRREALAMDPQQRVLLETAWEAVERAHLDPATLRGTRTGVFVGTTEQRYGPAPHRAPTDSSGYTLTGTTPSVASGRIAYVLGLEGPVLTVDTACSSSLVALHLAVAALRRGECERALACGVTVLATPGIFTEFSKHGGLSPDGRCKPFSADADGTAWAEGAAAVLVERLSTARRAGRAVLAVVRGTAINSDGASNGLTAPSGTAQRAVIAAALADAGLTPRDVDAVEAHGTGTRLGDPVEARALAAAYGADRAPEHPLWIGSVKSNLGHTQAAAGLTGVVKMVLALRRGVLPRTLHVDEPTPLAEWTGIRPLTRARPWPDTGAPRRAGVSSFGISGTNAHVILEQAPEDGPADATDATDAVVPWVLSARDDTALRAQASRLLAWCERNPEARMVDIGHTLATARTACARRVVVSGGDRAELLDGLRGVADGVFPTPDTTDDTDWTAVAARAAPRPVDIPTYPFQRRRFWLDESGRECLPRGSDGSVSRSTVLALDTHPWLADHVINGVTVVPGTVLVDLVAAAAAEVGCHEITELTQRSPVAVPDDGGVTVRVGVEGPDRGGRRRFRVESRPTGDGDWIPHAAGVLDAVTTSADPVGPPAGGEPVSLADTYLRLAARGYRYGDAFRCVRSAWRDGDTVYADVRVPAGDWFGPSPLALDAALHPALATMLDDAAVRMPVEWTRVRLHGTDSDRLRVRVSRAEPGQLALTATDDQGAEVASAVVTLRPAPPAAWRPVDLFQVRWREIERTQAGTGACVCVGTNARPVATALRATGVDITEVADLDTAPTGVDTSIITVLAPPESGTVPDRTRTLVGRALELARVWLGDERFTSCRLVVLAPAGDLATGAALGLLGAAQAEAPGRLVLVRVDHPDVDGRALLAGLAAGVPRFAVRGGDVRVPHLAPVTAPTRAVESLAEGTTLITGGTGALGAQVARRLVTTHGVRDLLLLSRRGQRAPGAERLRAELRALGARVTIRAGDVADRADVAAALAAADPPVRVVVHAAGVLADAVADTLTDEQVAAVLRPKVDGAWHLHELTKGTDLAAFVLFSSVMATAGGAGQANYAAANAFLDALAEHRRAAGLPGTALGWGAWAGTGMVGRLEASARARLRGRGIEPMAVPHALDLFDAALAADLPTVVPCVFGESFADDAVAVDGVPADNGAAAAPSESPWVDRMAALAGPDRAAAVRGLVRATVCRVLGESADEPVDLDRPFFDLGFDSLAGVNLRALLAKATSLSLPRSLVFNHPSPAAVTAYLLDRVAAPEPARPPAVVVDREPPDDAIDDAIAVVATACRLPGSINGPEDLWRALDEGRDAVTALPADRGWDLDTLFDSDPGAAGRLYCRAAGFIDGIDEFDADFFDIAPRDAAVIDPQQRLLLELAWECFERAGVVPESMRGSRTGVFAGVMYSDHSAIVDTLPEAEGHVGTGTYSSVASGRVAYTFGLEGPAVTVDTACSSSLVAVHLAVQALRRGECELALAGGVTVMSTPRTLVRFSRQRALAPDGRCKAFAAAADGTGFAEGAAMIALQRLADARATGRPVLAVLRGSAVNSDGASNGLTAPNGRAQERVLAAALADARLKPSEVDAVEAHGTGTTLGDPVEAEALLAVYGRDHRARPLWLGSLKSNVGHTQAAAGVAGLIKVVEALRHQRLPRTLHVDAPTPRVDWSANAVALLTEPRPWPRSEQPRRAGVSSFGVSGTNVHLIVEEAPDAESLAAPACLAGPVPCRLSGRDDGALRAQAERLAEHLRSHPRLDVLDVGYSLATTRSVFDHRVTVFARDREELLACLDALVRGATDSRVVAGEEPLVDWASLGDRAPRLVELPTYAFQRRRFRPPVAARTEQVPERVRHPLLTSVVESADGRVLLSGRIGLTRQPWLADHGVGGTVLLPGTAMLDLAAHAGAVVACPLVADFLISAPLALPADSDRSVQVVVELADGNGSRAVAVFSRPDTGGEWTEHAAGTLSCEREPAPAPCATQPPPEASALDLVACRDTLAAAGYDHGPAFQGLCGAWRDGTDLYVEASLPADLRAEATGFVLHPALLDAVLRPLGLPHPARSVSGPVVPFAWGGVRLSATGAVRVRARLSVRTPDEASVVVTDTGGMPVAVIDSVRLRPMSARTDATGALFVPSWSPSASSAAEPQTAGGWGVVGADRLGLVAMLGATGSAVTWHETPDAVPDPAPGLLLTSWLPDGDAVPAAHALITAALDTIQAWLARDCLATTRLVLVTRGAVAVVGGDVPDPAAAALWGFAGAVQVEHPGRLVLLDLDPAADGTRDDVSEVIPRALHRDAPRLAVRGGVVHTPRLEPDDGHVLTAPAGAAAWRLTRGPHGTIDGLTPHPCADALAALGGSEVRVSVRASGLNFRDVLAALGQYPGDPGPLGVEAAGVVTEVGAAVTDLAPGDRVTGLFAGAFGPVAVTDRRLVVPVPEGWSFIQAASVPVAFLTAYYALADLANLHAGESVLVHAATGGVGMAAVQLARHWGAEVFATAAPAKQETAHRYGVPADHVASSRDVGFADRILDVTAGRGVDVVLNSLTGPFVDASLRVLPHGGRFLEMGKTDVRVADEVAARHPGVRYQAFDLLDAGPDHIQRLLVTLMDLFARGELHPLPVTTYDVRRARDAFRFLSTAKHVGKVVLTQGPWNADGTVLITGGTGTVGAAVARHLAARGVRHLLLTSRHGPDADGVGALRADLAAAGAEVRIAACDVTDADEVRALVAGVPAAHPLRAIVHAAGVVDDAPVTALTAGRVAAVLRPKVDGVWLLHAATHDLDLDAFVLFSSASGVLGVAGQAGYGAANAFLDALAHYRRARGLPATSLAWGLWAAPSGLTAGLSPADHARLAKQGIQPLDTNAALALFDTALAADHPVMVPAAWREPVQSALPAPRRPAPDPVPGGGGDWIQRLARVPVAERHHMLLELVRAKAAAVLGHPAGTTVPADRGFMDLGFDSLSVLDLRNQLRVATGLPLPSTLLFDHPTPEAVAQHLRAELAAAPTRWPRALDGLDQLDAELAELPAGGPEHTSAVARLADLLRRHTAHDDLAPATRDEVFALIDQELGTQ